MHIFLILFLFSKVSIKKGKKANHQPATFKLSYENDTFVFESTNTEKHLLFFFLIFTEIFQVERKSKYTIHYDSPNNKADR